MAREFPENPGIRPFQRTNKIAQPKENGKPVPKKGPKGRAEYAKAAITVLENRIAASKSEAQKTALVRAIGRWKEIIEKETDGTAKGQ